MHVTDPDSEGPRTMAVTISDVAHAAGVSKGAVSYALNGQPGVSDATRERILQVAKELGWKPSLRAKGLSSAKAYALGLVVARDPKLLGTDPFFPAFIAGIETTLAEHDYTLVLSVATAAGAEERAYRKLADGGRVDGVILTDVRHNDSRIGLLRELKPACGDAQPAGRRTRPFPAVSMDDTDGITAAVEHLVALGHSRIGHVGGAQEYIHGRSRREAWEAAMARAGLAADLFAEADFTAAGGSGRHRGTAPPAGPAHRDCLRQRPDGNLRPVVRPDPGPECPRRPVGHRL